MGVDKWRDFQFSTTLSILAFSPSPGELTRPDVSFLIRRKPDTIEPRRGYDFDVVLTGERARRVRRLLRSVRR